MADALKTSEIIIRGVNGITVFYGKCGDMGICCQIPSRSGGG